MKHMMAYILSSLLLIVLSGCSNIPKKISTAPSTDIQLNEVKIQNESFTNKEVRWGGEIVSVENNNKSSILEIVQYPLNHYGKPLTNRSSDGRFLAKTTEFLDPVIYKEGVLMTFIGNLNGMDNRKVDQKDLNMPVVEVSSMYKWQPHQTIERDPFYDPFFYGGFYPYHGFYNRYWYHPRFGYRYYH